MGPARLAAPIAVMAVLWVLSSTPDLGTGLEDWDLLLRKLGHAGAYATLLLTWVLALGRGRLAVALVLTIAYAAVDELHQSTVPTRNGTPVDVLIDAAGATLALLVLRARERRASATPARR